MYIGIDLGSRSVKLALQEEDKAMWLEKFDTLQFTVIMASVKTGAW